MTQLEACVDNFVSTQVTGVVGRAEMLSSVFFLGALLCYARAASRRRCTGMEHLDLKS